MHKVNFIFLGSFLIIWKNPKLVVGRLGFHAPFCSLLPVRPCTCHFTLRSLNLNFPYQSNKNNGLYLAGLLWIRGCVWYKFCLSLTITRRKAFKTFCYFGFLICKFCLWVSVGWAEENAGKGAGLELDGLCGPLKTCVL